MSRYRWIRPSKCLETMENFPSLEEKTHQELRKLLFDAVARGDVRGMLNDEIVPKAHISAYLTLFARATPNQEPNTLPADLALNYDDLSKVFDRPSIDNRKRGRPIKEHSAWSQDRQLAFEMHKMLAGPPSRKRATSATDAARILVDADRVSGGGTRESRIKRLVRVFRKHYSS